jgi:hypothetical protein
MKGKDGPEMPRECKMQSGECRPAINGISREKAQKAQRGGAATKDFEQEQTEKTERTSFAKNAFFLDVALQNSRNFDVGSRQDEFGRAGRTEQHKGCPRRRLGFRGLRSALSLPTLDRGVRRMGREQRRKTRQAAEELNLRHGNNRFFERSQRAALAGSLLFGGHGAKGIGPVGTTRNLAGFKLSGKTGMERESSNAARGRKYSVLKSFGGVGRYRKRKFGDE